MYRKSNGLVGIFSKNTALDFLSEGSEEFRIVSLFPLSFVF
jgi:hypothetical protein